MRLISDDDTINLSFDKWDFVITSPYLIPPVFYIKATTDHKEIIIDSFPNIEQAKYVLTEIQKCDSEGNKECRIKDIKKRMKNNVSC